MLSGEDVTLAFGAAIGLLTGLILLFALNCFNAVLHYLE
jgi:hypothetical protein